MAGKSTGIIRSEKFFGESAIDPSTIDSNLAAKGIRRYSSVNYISGLDGLRAVAVILVIAFHFAGESRQIALGQLGNFWGHFSVVANLGWIGVDIFFVISGFLIAQILENNPINSLKDYWNFISRRMRRLLPAYAVCVISITTIATIAFNDSKILYNQHLLWTLSANIESSFGDRNALADQNFSLVHFWSLSLEWHFYLLFPIILTILGSTIRAAVWLICIALLCRWTFWYLGLSDNAIYSFTFCRIDSLAFGVLLFAGYQSCSSIVSTLIAIIGAMLFVSILFVLFASDGHFKALTWLQTVGYSAIGISIAMMLLGILKWDPSSMLLRLLEQDWLTVVGRSSYSLYIWHLAFFPMIKNSALYSFGDRTHQWLITLFTASLLTALMGTASYLLIESKLLQNFKKIRKSQIA